MNKVMMSLAGVVAMAAAAFAEGNGGPQRNEIGVGGEGAKGARPARKRFSSAAIARIYDSTWKVAGPAPEGAPVSSARTRAIHEKSFDPRLTPMDAVAALPTVGSVVPALAPVMPDASSIAEDLALPAAPVLAPLSPDMIAMEDELEELSYMREDLRVIENNGGAKGPVAEKDTTQYEPPSDVGGDADTEDSSVAPE